MIAQAVLALCVLVTIAFAPPASGQMLLVPVMPGSAARIAHFALAHDAMLVGSGPVAGSLVVTGNRDQLISGVMGAGGLLVSAPRAFCGERLRYSEGRA